MVIDFKNRKIKLYLDGKEIGIVTDIKHYDYKYDEEDVILEEKTKNEFNSMDENEK